MYSYPFIFLPLKSFFFDATSFSHQHLAIIYLPFVSSLLHMSSSFRFGWGQTHIFRFLQKYFIGFKFRLWLGHSKTSTALCINHSCCVLRVIVLLEGKPSARLRFWMLWTGFSLRLSQYFGALSFYIYSNESLCPCRWKIASQHEAATSTLYFWDGTLQVMSRAGSLQRWCLELRFIRPENRVSQSLRVL